MNKKNFLLAFVLICVGYTVSHGITVHAKETLCYVKEDHDDGDGSKDDPFEDVKEALTHDCEKIIIKKGTYKDDITVNRSVTLQGESQTDVIITGEVIMQNKSKLNKLTVSSSDGIVVAKDASVSIDSIRIKNADVGITTKAGGKLSVKDSKIYNNRKGFYIQEGKTIELTDNEVYDNDEEGIDIRANVEGEISSNTIYDNGESGIELILGKTELDIIGNSIKNNKASGIAVQYYKENSTIGTVKIKSNSISHNDSYGISCKYPSSSAPAQSYWSQSVTLKSNKIKNNDHGDFSDDCNKFEKEESTSNNTEQSTKTPPVTTEKESQKKPTVLTQQRAEIVQAQKSQTNQQSELTKAHNNRVELQNESDITRNKLQKDMEWKDAVVTVREDIKKLTEHNKKLKKRAEQRSSLLKFIIGPNYGALMDIKKTLNTYTERIDQIKEAEKQVNDAELRAEISAMREEIVTEKEEFSQFTQSEQKEFGIFGWLFRK